MSRHFSMRFALAAAVAVALFVPPAASAAPAPVPAWSLQATSAPSYFKPGDTSGDAVYEVFLTNSGAVPSDGSPIMITDTLPAGLGVKAVEVTNERERFANLNGSGEICDTQTAEGVATVTCELTEAPTPGVSAGTKPALVNPSEQVLVQIHVTVPDGEAVVPLTNQVEVQGGGAEAASAESQNRIDPACEDTRECAPAGFQTFSSNLTGADGKPTTGAASHPFQFMTGFAVNLNPSPPGSLFPFIPARGDLKRIEVTLPPGLIANPTATAFCTARQFNTVHGASPEGGVNVFLNECPDAAAVGVALIQQLEGISEIGGHVPIYSLVPPPGMPAQFGFQPNFGLPVYIDTALVRGPEGFTVRAFLRNVTEAKRVTLAQTFFWGTPADPSHDPLRGNCAFLGGSCPANLPVVKPSVRLPSSCENPLLTTMSFETWAQPPTGASVTVSEPAPVACEQPDFSPSIESKPTTNVTDSPAGLNFELHLPQVANEDPEGLSEADLRDATVTLPPGLVLNPAAADGRAACSPAQIGLQSGVGASPIVFDQAPASCPDASKVGRVEVDTPLLDHPIPGSVYLASQAQNPFDSLLAIYIALEDSGAGINIKLAGKVTPNPVTGQLTTTFPANPQVPFEDLRFDFFEGARAPLRTPQTCGPHTTNTTMVPWSAPEGATAFPSDSFTLAQSPGGACPSSAAALPNSPFFEAGTTDPLAAAYSPFVLRLKREDGSQELAGLELALPQGLTGKLAGIAECSEAGLAQAKAREVPGQGATEKASPSCPASSRIGSVTVGAGAGPAPFYTQGNAYLAGPYKGAPLSMAIITPAVAGPFDLGAVVVRAALQVNPETARITAVSDPIPQIIEGIPLDVRSIAVKLDRPGFTLNPSSCEAMAISGQATSTLGQIANLNNRFQVGGCSNLGFKPKLSFKLRGDTKRGGFPGLTATLTYPKAGAYSNIARAQVALPHSEFLAQAHIRTICTRVQFAANACPKGSIYGKAKAITPLLDKPLEGPVYLRSSSNPLPDLVADLNGQIHVALVGRIDSVNGSIRNSFEAVPDAPVSKFTLSLPAGKKGLLENSTDICRGTHKAKATFTAHNGKAVVLKPELEAKCKAKSRKGSKGRSSHSRRP